MIEYIHFRQISPDVNTRDFESHHCAVGFIPTGLAAIATTSTAVCITVGQSFGDLSIRLDSFCMGMNDIPQQTGI